MVLKPALPKDQVLSLAGDNVCIEFFVVATVSNVENSYAVDDRRVRIVYNLIDRAWDNRQDSSLGTDGSAHGGGRKAEAPKVNIGRGKD